jgi:serine/threonine-protein kinase
MSPEAASGAEMTPLSDQYALGVVLYECLTGVNPFAAATNFAEVVLRLSTGDFTPVLVQNPQLSKRMAAIIERAMQLDPARRFADMRAMGRELLMLAGQRTRVTWALTFNNPVLGALTHAPVDFHDQPPVTVRERPHRRSRALLLVPALVTLVLAGGAWATGALRYDGAARASLAAFAANAGLIAQPAPTGERVVDAAGQPPPLRMALRPDPQQAELGIGSAAAPGAVLPLATVEAAPDAFPAGTSLELSAAASEPSSAARANGTAIAVSQALRGARPRLRTSSTRNKDTNVRSASSPEWLSTSARPAGIRDNMSYGTNNAPIFD